MILTQLFRKPSSAVEARELTIEEWLIKALNGKSGSTPSASSVSASSIMTLSAVAACTRAIAETVGMLPLYLYWMDTGPGKSSRYHTLSQGNLAADQPMFRMLLEQPNPEMDAMSFWEALVGQAVILGTAYAEIQRDSVGRPVHLWPLMATNMVVERDRSGNRVYRYLIPERMEYVPIKAENVFCLHGPSMDGSVGLNPVTLFREVFGLAMDAEKYSGRYFSNNAQPAGILESPRVLGKTVRERVLATWKEMHEGMNNAFRIGILENGITFKSIAGTPRDSMLIESRGFQTEEVARIFRVPLFMIGHHKSGIGGTVEEQGIQFSQTTVAPWTTRIELAVMSQILYRAPTPAPRGGRRLYPQYHTEVLLRGVTSQRYQSYNTAILGGWLTPNEARNFEGLPPIEGGDSLVVPINTTMTSGGNTGGDPETTKKAGAVKSVDEPEEEEESDEG